MKEIDNNHVGVSDVKRLKCHLCDRDYNDKAALKVHLDAVHYKKIYNCDTCNKPYNSKANLRTHKVKAHNAPKIIKDTNTKCESCNVELETRKSYRKHMRVTFS